MKEPIFAKLDLGDEDFIITQYWDKENQIDLIVEHSRDRISRAIEIKWINEKRINLKKIYEELESKDYPIPKNFTRRNFLAISSKHKKRDTKFPVITIEDIF